MENICGECDKPFSKNCQTKKHCTVHNKACFECSQCKPSQRIRQLEACFSCKNPCEIEQAFYEGNCNVFICKNQFLKCDFKSPEIKLPCGCLEMKEHIVAFMSEFCFSCLRRLKNSDINMVRLCGLCINKNQEVETTSKDKCNSNGEKGDKGINSLKAWLSSSKKEVEEKQLSQKDSSKSQKLIIQLLNQDFKKSQDHLKVSEFTRIEIKKFLFTAERDKQCLICSLSYTMVNKPVMICLQQHLLCEKCLKEQYSLKNCPLCSQPIQKDKVRVSRERLKTLQMQNIINEKFSTKHKRYLAYCNNDCQKLHYRFDAKDAQTQTQQSDSKSVESPVKEQLPTSMKKRGRTSKPQPGDKRQKLM